MTKQAIINISNSTIKRVSIQTPYSPEFVAELKALTTTRQWDSDAKVWTVETAEAQAAIDIAARYFEIVDARYMNTDNSRNCWPGVNIRKNTHGDY